jgi:cytoskeletal protein CcmA (bactofilin family)
MKKSKKNIAENYSTTLISREVRIDAKLLSGSGILRVEGEYHGEVYIDGDLILEKSGYINGNVNVKAAYIYGAITGNVKCSDLLHITATGKLTGDIECEAILMDEGAVFMGHCKMNERESDPESDLLGIENMRE